MLNWLCGELGIDKAEILSVRRELKLIRARRVVVVFLRNLGWSYPQIGRMLNRHYTSVRHLHQTVEVADASYAELLFTRWIMREKK